MKPIIRVRNLSKQYRIGARRASYATLKESLAGALRSPFKRVTGRNGDSSDERIWALKDISFDVMPGEVVGIIGRNGAGKSTLLKVLSRITEPTKGRGELYGRVGSLLEVGTGFHPELTGRENIYLNGAVLGMSRREIDRKFDEIVAFAEIEKFIDTPVKRYSSGMYMRLAFAVAAHLEPEILIIDEVLAVGDAAFQKKCLGKMRNVAKAGRTVLFVSHNMAAVQHLCTKALFLNMGEMRGSISVREAISLYLEEGQSGQAVFPNQPLRKVSVRQLEEAIEIRAEYVHERELNVPCLGFVISDHLGNPICGSNPLLDLPEQLLVPTKSGVVSATLQYPKLLNGTYRLSLWFGDGRKDGSYIEYFREKDCLIFEVIGMVTSRQLPIEQVGPVSPSCQWSFTPYP